MKVESFTPPAEDGTFGSVTIVLSQRNLQQLLEQVQLPRDDNPLLLRDDSSTKMRLVVVAEPDAEHYVTRAAGRGFDYA